MILLRFAYLPQGVLGRLMVKDFECYTIERPWLNNQVSVSCIPDGYYPLGIDQEGKYTGHPEILSVPGRTEIIIHPANWAHELEGCIAPGMDWAVGGKQPRVMRSRVAYSEIMDRYEGERWIQVLSQKTSYTAQSAA